MADTSHETPTSKPLTDRRWFKSVLWLASVFGGLLTAVIFGKLAVWMWNWPIW